MIDLSYLWPGSENAYNVIKQANNLGWSSLGFNVYFKADGQGIHQLNYQIDSFKLITNSERKYPSFYLNNQVSPIVNTNLDQTDLVLGHNFIRRMTVFLMDDFKPNSLTKFIESNDYETFSVIPTTKKSFLVACENLNCDLINLNFYCYYSPFKLRRGFINLALQRGCFFELSLSDKLIRNLDLGNNFGLNNKESLVTAFQRNLPNVLKYIPPKKLVLSSGSSDLTDLLDPKLLIGTFNSLFKESTGQDFNLKMSLTKVPMDCINKGAARRTFGTGIVSYKDEIGLGKTFS